MMTPPISAEATRPAAARPTAQIVIGLLVIPLLLGALIAGYFLYLRLTASPELIVPQQQVLLVRSQPAETAPLLARFGEGSRLTITGRTADWGWLEVELGQGGRGWALRPLDILVWHLTAAPSLPQTGLAGPPAVTPVSEKMITIPATSFTMGSPPGLGEADEQPAHPVSLSAFAIDQTEVTVGQYWQCVQARACAAPSRENSQSQTHYLNDPSFDNYPVVNVPWTEANNYCLWRGKRLPTEAEWEMAAGWNDAQKAKLLWPWGNTTAQAGVNIAAAGPAPVGTFPADRAPAGGLDMGGNVSEWVFDWYKVDYYSVADNSDPTGPSNRRGEGAGRVVRGGSFADPIEMARVANRRYQAESYGYPTVGFRCAVNSGAK
jgi:formylglycine-generating enzyme required for sulfatase activity